jgi:hypothetical protein
VEGGLGRFLAKADRDFEFLAKADLDFVGDWRYLSVSFFWKGIKLFCFHSFNGRGGAEFIYIYVWICTAFVCSLPPPLSFAETLCICICFLRRRFLCVCLSVCGRVFVCICLSISVYMFVYLSVYMFVCLHVCCILW